MIDANIRQLIDPPLAGAGRLLAAVGVGIAADAITVGGCLLGLAAALSASFGRFYIALVLLIASRIADGLDGAVARATRRTDRGAFLDIVLDFLVYATVPLGFAIWSPHTNALPAALLLVFVGRFAALACIRRSKPSASARESEAARLNRRACICSPVPHPAVRGPLPRRDRIRSILP